MAFRWVAGGASAPDRAADAALAHVFPTRTDAEEWLTASYTDLADVGVVEVTLMEDDHVVYGPMSLLP